VGAILKQLTETTGVDVTGILAGGRPAAPPDDEAKARRRQQAALAASTKEVG
jgi:hypothetical protein